MFSPPRALITLSLAFLAGCCGGSHPAQQTKSLSAAPAAAHSYLVYVGTYTNTNKSKGVYVMRMDAATGTLSTPEVAAEVINPSFLTIHPTNKFLYTVGEAGGPSGGAVTAFSIDSASGKLTKLNEQNSGGAGPCYINTNHAGNVALVANYGGGSFESLPVSPDGKLSPPATFIQDTGSGPNPARQKEPHSHSLNPSPDDRFALGCDLGLDKIFVFKIDPTTAKLTPNDPPFAATPPGGGPRHIAFHPSNKFVFACNEMGNSVTAYTYDAQAGTLKQINTVSTLPADYADAATNSTAEVQVHPSGKFAYVSNRGHNSIAVFDIDPSTGALTPKGHVSTGGKTPRGFRLDPTGLWLLAAHQSSDNLFEFKVDPNTGMPSPVGTEIKIGAPVCIKFVPVD